MKSFAEDICYAASRGQWMMPKHLLLGMTLRHLTGSAEIISLIHRFGHCASYTSLLELETAMCKSAERDTVLPKTIDPDRNVVTHFCWDNFDLLEETSSGLGTTHTAHGLIIQEVSMDGVCVQSELPCSLRKTKERSVTYKPTEIDPCFVKSHAEPNMSLVSTDVTSTESSNAIFSDMLWICA